MTTPKAIVFEDDPILGIIFQTTLQQAGFETELDSLAKHFPERLASLPPTLVILDIHLPYISGVEMLKQIRQNKNWASTIVIVVTADLYLSKTIKDEADYVLIKPVSVTKILGIVAHHWPDLPSNLPQGSVTP